MVLSRRVSAHVEGPHYVFDGSEGNDVRRFVFAYENIIMKDVPDEEKAKSLVGYLSGDACDYYFNTFVKENQFTSDALDYFIVRSWLLKTFVKKADPDEIIRRAVEARLDFDRLKDSSDEIDELYEQAGFNEEAKFGLLRKAVMQDSALAHFSATRGFTDYQTLREIILEYIRNKPALDQYVFLTPMATPTNEERRRNTKPTPQPSGRTTYISGRSSAEGGSHRIGDPSHAQSNGGGASSSNAHLDLKKVEGRMDDLTAMMSSMALAIKKIQPPAGRFPPGPLIGIPEAL